MAERFTFRVTVGAVIEKDGKILVVRELLSKRDPKGQQVITQPGGHVDDHESILDAAAREVLEETGYTVKPTSLIGIYQSRYKDSAAVRFSFTCELLDVPPQAITDPDVLEATWMTVDELKSKRAEYRTEAATQTFDDYFAGKRSPIDVVSWYTDHTKTP